MLDKNPQRRIGAERRDDVRNHPFFENLNWEKLECMKIKPPINLNEFVHDNLEKFPSSKFFKDLDYTEENKQENRVNGFTFVNTDK